jgi:hypothetical protein
MHHVFDKYDAYSGDIVTRREGAMVSWEPALPPPTRCTTLRSAAFFSWDRARKSTRGSHRAKREAA